MRNKIQCKANTKDGLPCKSWAISGHATCRKHLHLESAELIKRANTEFKEANNLSIVITLLIIILGHIISSAGGCQVAFLKWMRH
jgi:hypothetical protein